jgi:hypothetical protein
MPLLGMIELSLSLSILMREQVVWETGVNFEIAAPQPIHCRAEAREATGVVGSSEMQRRSGVSFFASGKDGDS